MLNRFGGFFERWPQAFQPCQDESHLAHVQTGHRGFDPFLRSPGRAMLLAVGFLLAMILTGKLPETRQLASFEARGVLAVPPDRSAAWGCMLASPR